MARWIETVVVRNSIDEATVAVVQTLIGDDTDARAGNIKELIKVAVTDWAGHEEG